MKPVTTTVRVPKAAKALAAASVAICTAFATIVDKEKVLAVGLSLGVLVAVAAAVAYAFAPKRTVVLLEVHGDVLHIRSRTGPLDVGLRYLPGVGVPIESIREIVSRVLNLSRWGTFVDVSLTRRDGTVETIFFPGELRDEVREFFRQLQERWPSVEVADGGYHTRVTWRNPWKSLIRPHGRQRRDTTGSRPSS